MALMGALMELQELATGTTFAVAAPAAALAGLSLLLINGYVNEKRRRRRSQLPPLPEVAGLPVIGNLLQLTEKKPHMTFARWAKTYGPIYSIKTGSNRIVVINSNDVAKEVYSLMVYLHCDRGEANAATEERLLCVDPTVMAFSLSVVSIEGSGGFGFGVIGECIISAMVTRFSSISTRKLTKALSILTFNKCMVATSDYDDFHKTVKRHILTSLLGPNAQKQHRCLRDNLIANIVKHFHAHVKGSGLQPVNFRNIFESELFGLALKEALGNDVESIDTEELGNLSRHEIFDILVKDPMEGAIDVDWRDFFPYLKWIPNRTFEMKIEQMDFRRQAVMRALIMQQSKRVASGEEKNSYFDYLLKNGKSLTEKQIAMLLWEVIIETSDTTFVTSEWAMYELAKNPKMQDCLYEEIRGVCGSDNITEEKLCQLPFLSAVFHETLRKYSPAPVIPLRFAHEDTELGGYFVPAGSEIAINIYGCNMDENQWEKPEEWNPKRFLDKKYDQNDMHKTMAFGAGKRVCAGSLQAMLIACTSIGRLIQEFEWRLKEGEEEDVDIVGLTTQKLHPLHAILRPRNQ